MPEKKTNHTDEYLIKKVQRLAKTWDPESLCEYFGITKAQLDKIIKTEVAEPDAPSTDQGCENC